MCTQILVKKQDGQYDKVMNEIDYYMEMITCVP
jgi:hypothetical protein